MNNSLFALKLLPIGKEATVRELAIQGAIRRRMLDLGLIPGTQVEALHKSPSGDPIAYGIRGAVIAIRSEETSKIFVSMY